MKNEANNFLAQSNQRYEYVRGDYVLGYASDVTYHLKLKPGSYLLRLKIEKLHPEYRTLINVTSSCPVKLSQNKPSSGAEETLLLAQTLSSKGRIEQKNIVYPNGNVKQTWIMMNNDFSQLGYGAILFQVGKGDNRRITITVEQQYFFAYSEKSRSADTG